MVRKISNCWTFCSFFPMISFCFEVPTYFISPLSNKNNTHSSRARTVIILVPFPIIMVYLWLYRFFNPISYILVEYVSRDVYNLLTILEQTVKGIYGLVIQGFLCLFISLLHSTSNNNRVKLSSFCCYWKLWTVVSLSINITYITDKLFCLQCPPW